MKTKLLTALCAISLFASATPASAEDKSLDVVVDAALVRPSCFIVTVAGSVLFVAILPVAAVSRSVKQTEHTLVGVPANATFNRPMGDFASLEDN
jgi:hypothetical protein